MANFVSTDASGSALSSTSAERSGVIDGFSK